MKNHANPHPGLPGPATPIHTTNKPPRALAPRPAAPMIRSGPVPDERPYARLPGLLAQSTVASARSGSVPVEIHYMRLPELLRMVPFSASTVWRKVKDRTMPAPVHLSARISAWNRAAIVQWLAEREAS